MFPILLAGFSCQETVRETPAPRTYGKPVLAAKLTDPEVNESSGLARSHAEPGFYFTHNDSGDKPRFWKFDGTGRCFGPFSVAGAQAVDWEDMASAKVGDRPRLFFADIGDNAERRASVQIYVVDEPLPGASATESAEVFDLRYPGKPHNAEAFLVNPVTGDWTIVTKTSKGPARIFTLSGMNKPGRFTLKEVGTVEIGAGIDAAMLVTAGDFSPDGRFVVLRTYLAAYEFDVPADGAWWRSKPRRIETAAELQGEAIAYSVDGKQILTTSEFAPCPVSSVSVGG